MARPVSITKERIIQAAMGIVRSSGPGALTARSLTRAIDCGANAVFAAFGSMDGVLDAVKAEAREQYRKRVGSGFSLNPPFKGFGISLLWFAMDEPKLYKLIMESDTPMCSFEDYIDKYVGFKDECLRAISESLSIEGRDAEMIYYQMCIVALGLACSCTDGQAPLYLEQVSRILGKNLRSFLMVIRAGGDEREGFIPNASGGPAGNVESYIDKYMITLASQNHLLKELHAQPRYIRDNEWLEVERVFRNTMSLTPESLRHDYPAITSGDVKLIMLSCLKFTVSQQSVLLGISPGSVTKARQRLKAKMGGNSLESFCAKSHQ